MEYAKREMMKSASGREPTAFTMKTIKELLAEDGAATPDAVTMQTPLPKNKVQQPPHMRGPVPVVQNQAKPARKPVLKSSAAPKIDADLTMPPQALPASVSQATAAVQHHASAAQPASAEAAPEPKKRSLFGRLIGG